MASLRKTIFSRERGAALIIVLAFAVLLTGLVLAYFSRTTSDRQVAHSSFNQAKVDQIVASAMDNVIGDLRQEIVNGSTATTINSVTVYTPKSVGTRTSNDNMLPVRNAPNTIPNLVRISVRSGIPAPALSSRASAVNSTTDLSANGRLVTLPSWNKHYLIPRPVGASADNTTPIPDFTAPDWVFVSNTGPAPIIAPNSSIIGRYAYAIYDEGGLLDANVAGYPPLPNTTTIQSGRKGSEAFADLTALGISTTGVNNIVGFRNYASAQPGGDFASNFTFTAASGTRYYNYVIANNTGFLTVNPVPTPSPATLASRTDQAFVLRQELINFCRATPGGMFTADALQYLGTFSRETNSPSFSPSTPTGSTIDYATLANSGTATNPNFLGARATASFTRFDGTTANVGDPLVKTRFPLSRLAWITYKGPSAVVYAANNSDPVIIALTAAGVPLSTIQAGTAANITQCFGLTFQVGGTAGAPWTYSHGATNRILRLDEVAATLREPDFFELLQAGILSGSLGQSSGGVSPAGSTVFGTLNTAATNYMSNVTEHLLAIGAAIIDQADPDSIPTRIQFIGTNGTTWASYGVENLPYITQLYPIAGISPDTPTQWATYLLFQLWNPHQSAPTIANNVRLRVDGGVGLFTGGNGQAWSAATAPQFIAPAGGLSVVLKSGPLSSFSPPTPLRTDNASATSSAQSTFAFLPAPAVPAPTP